jgi:hypothetical protein
MYSCCLQHGSHSWHAADNYIVQTEQHTLCYAPTAELVNAQSTLRSCMVHGRCLIMLVVIACVNFQGVNTHISCPLIALRHGATSGMRLIVSRSVARAAAMDTVILYALHTLQGAEDKAAIAGAALHFNSWQLAMHSTPFTTSNSILQLGKMPYTLFVSCADSAISAVLCNTAMQQLAGDRVLGDWTPVTQVWCGTSTVYSAQPIACNSRGLKPGRGSCIAHHRQRPVA